MKRLAVAAAGCVVLFLGLVGGSPTRAELCVIDAVPAATLLLPYFEVDLNKNKAPDVVVSLNNSSAAPAAAQVTLWTDESLPTLTFTVLLTGYDVELFSLRELFQGILPDGVDPACVGPSASALKKPRRGKKKIGRGPTRFASRHTSDSSAVARGYMTIDNVNEACVTAFPSDPDYFQNGGNGIANNVNQLYGEYYYSSNKLLTANRLVAIEAGNRPSVTTPGNYTFYGRYSDFDARDNREPLNGAWAARYIDDGAAKTYLQVWRDSGPFDQPLPQTEVIAFDEQEEAFELGFDPPIDLFPIEAQQERVNDLDVPFPAAGSSST